MVFNFLLIFGQIRKCDNFLNRILALSLQDISFYIFTLLDLMKKPQSVFKPFFMFGKGRAVEA